eukprot:2447450-Pyramimonas_sp.AAC.1
MSITSRVAPSAAKTRARSFSHRIDSPTITAGWSKRPPRTVREEKRREPPGRGGLQGARPRAWQLGGPTSRGL